MFTELFKKGLVAPPRHAISHLANGELEDALRDLEAIEEGSWAGKEVKALDLKEKIKAGQEKKANARQNGEVVNPFPVVDLEKIDPAKKEEAMAIAKEGKRLILQSPEEAARFFEQALLLYPSAKLRSGYALALERADRYCEAHLQYELSLPDLSGKAKERAQKGIDRFNDRCK